MVKDLKLLILHDPQPVRISLILPMNNDPAVIEFSV